MCTVCTIYSFFYFSNRVSSVNTDIKSSRYIIGEVRGAESVDMLQALNTGHAGSMSTAHSNSAKDMLYRLETMVLMGMDIPALAVRRQLASGIDLMIHLGRLRDKRRVIMEISEMDGCVDGEIRLNPIYVFRENGIGENGKILGSWIKTGTLHHKEKLFMAGLDNGEGLSDL